MTSAITSQVTHPPLPAAEQILPARDGYGVHEVAAVTLGELLAACGATCTATETAHVSNLTPDRRLG